ncbi:MAG: non-canonical purine NTP pyrophosphatase [Phycisphaeraceae bacterium]|nr:non-canonical purine NTP pyrophosphatase [Phycisphaerae bacterium]MBX3392733.1 non-canonical purine NTP pyrophosphatase [Phycisphaeraceae bacterium]HRJ50395.1 non-canonical purine NTP pyrophosphatase [Phycisphaerales bacterium]
MDIVLATANPHKVDEMRSIFDRWMDRGRVTVRRLAEIGVPTLEPSETGSTFAENARIKAESYALQTGRWCLADDSGLEIDALDGRPGVISSHYCTDGVEVGMTRDRRDLANNGRVLRELSGVAREKRTARFVCVMCLAAPPGSAEGPVFARGVFEGRIGIPPEVPRGANGFGYDPVFLVGPAYERTGAELSAEEKNAASHRGSAGRAMAVILAEKIAREHVSG